MKSKLLYLIALVSFGCAVPVLHTGCKNNTTLEAGGLYTEKTYAQIDQTILSASKTMRGFVQWHAINATYLARWPAIGGLAADVSEKEAGWILDAYAARDAYAAAFEDYKKAIADGNAAALPPSQIKLNAALTILDNITKQIIAYKAAHPNA